MAWLKHLIDFGVLAILLAMSITAFGIFLERRRVLKSVQVEQFSNRKELELALTRRLHLIAIIASNAPYIGLLGTVLGIINTFALMGADGQMEPGRIMSSLSLALEATAGGLLVAIPAVTLYNLLLRQVKVLLMRWDICHG
jgi:biopolymer transport protein ExbB